MKNLPRAIKGSQAFESDSDDEDYPATRFFSDAMAQKAMAPVARPKRSFKLKAVGAGLILVLIALLALAALLNS